MSFASSFDTIKMFSYIPKIAFQLPGASSSVIHHSHHAQHFIWDFLTSWTPIIFAFLSCFTSSTIWMFWLSKSRSKASYESLFVESVRMFWLHILPLISYLYLPPSWALMRQYPIRLLGYFMLMSWICSASLWKGKYVYFSPFLIMFVLEIPSLDPSPVFIHSDINGRMSEFSKIWFASEEWIFLSTWMIFLVSMTNCNPIIITLALLSYFFLGHCFRSIPGSITSYVTFALTLSCTLLTMSIGVTTTMGSYSDTYVMMDLIPPNLTALYSYFYFYSYVIILIIILMVLPIAKE